MDYNEFKRRAHENAVNHGFWEKRLSNEHFLMLIVTEISEMVEADRKNEHAGAGIGMLMRKDLDNGETFKNVFEARVKNTVEDELADVAIRFFDLAGALNLDFDKMNPCRYYRSFSKFSFTENALCLVKGISRDDICIERRIMFALNYVEVWAQVLNIDLEWHIEQKMRYNALRPYKHGKNY